MRSLYREKQKYVEAKFNLSFVCFRYLDSRAPRHHLSFVDLSTMAVQTSKKTAKI